MRRKTRSLAVALVAAVAGVAAAAAGAAERPLSLNEAIGRALDKNESLVIERAGVAAANAAIDGAHGAYDQLVELEGSWRRSRDPFSLLPGSSTPSDNQTRGLSLAVRQLMPTGGALTLRASGARDRTKSGFALFSPSYGTQLGVELRQPLLRDLSIDAARFSVRTAEAERHGAQASLRRAMSETVAYVERAYWALVAARLTAEVREEAVKLAEEQLAQTRLRVGSHTLARTELAQPEAELERRRGELLAGREAASRAQNALKLLILSDADPAWPDEIIPTDGMEVDVTQIDPAGSLQRALALRPELALAGATLERRQVETRFARNRVRPSLAAVASYDRFGMAGTPLGGSAAGSGGLDDSFQSLRDNDFNDARVALVLGLPIRNSTARAAVAAAGHVERQAQAEIALVRKSIRAEVMDAAAALETAGQRIEAARSGRQAAEIQLAAEKDRYEAGLSTNFLVLTRQNDLSRARLDEISALTDYRTARSELARADGSLLEQRGVRVETKAK